MYSSNSEYDALRAFVPLLPKLDLSVDGQPRVEDLGVSHSESLVESADSLDILLGQLYFRALEVLNHSFRLNGLGNDNNVALGAPSKEDLTGGRVVAFGDLADHRMGEKGLDLGSGGNAEFEPAVRVKSVMEATRQRIGRAYLAGPKVENAIILIPNASHRSIRSC